MMPFRKRLYCHSLQHMTESRFLLGLLTRNCTKKPGKASWSTSISASLTVECAWILPLFFMGMLMMAGFLNMLRLQTTLHASLWESAKELGMYAYGVEGEGDGVDIFSQAAGYVYAKTQMEQDLGDENWIGLQGGTQGIALWKSEISTSEITLRAEYTYQFPASLLPIADLPFFCECTVYPWVGALEKGEGVTGEGREMVYVSDWESVYHLDSSCTHLDLTVTTILGNQIGSRRNQYGERYAACDKCADDVSGYRTYYITQQGDCYHATRTCSGIKRSVRIVRMEDVEALRACSRCG